MASKRRQGPEGAAQRAAGERSSLDQDRRWRDVLDPGWQRAFEWVEARLGGRVVHFERHPRWRPAFYLDVERAGETLPLYFRGDRGALDHGVYPLEHEMRVLELLEKHGIPVPHVWGFCPEPRGILMQRCAGRSNLATAESEEERRAVLDHYVEIIARMHAIDPAEAEAIGIRRPRTPEELGLGDLDHWERSYRQKKRRAEPMIEFTLRWLRRNVPRHRSRVALIQADSGQFLFERGRITALHDFELATLGDPLAEFAGLRNRTLSEPLGDLRRALRRYEELSGEPADLRAIDYHTVRFGLVTPLATAHVVADPPPGVELVQYLAWYLIYGRLCLEVLAHAMGLELAPIELPEPATTRHSSAHAALVAMLAPRPGRDAYEAYELRAAERVARYLARAEQLGAALAEQDLDEAGALLGRRPGSWGEAEARLEAFVLRAGPDADARLVRYFHRQVRRHEALLAGVLGELEGVEIAMLD
jgi:aminoglycoside phosphotransferase (APT) family kinase protein